MWLDDSLRLLLEGANYLTGGRHNCVWIMLDLLDEISKSDFGDANAEVISRLRELAEIYGRCFARGADGESAEVSSSDLADQIKMGVLRLMNSHLQWKRSFRAENS